MLWLQCSFRVGGVTRAVRASEMIRGLPIIGQGSNSGEDPIEVVGCREAISMIDEAEDRAGSGRRSEKVLLGVKMLVGLLEDTLKSEQVMKEVSYHDQVFRILCITIAGMEKDKLKRASK